MLKDDVPFPNSRLLVIICLILLSCNAHKQNDSHTGNAVIQKERIILYHEDSSISSKDKVPYLRNFAKNLGIPVLLGGYKGLYIRIWAWDFEDNKYIIDINESSSGNACSIISFIPKRKDTGSYIIVLEKRSVTPQSGWKDFFRSLEKYRLPEIKSEKLSKEQKTRFTSMEYILFEIDQPDQYRFYEYPDPFYFKDEDTASANIYNFLKFFNKEMKTNVCDIEKKAKDSIDH